MVDLPDRGIWGPLRGCSGWISCMWCDIRCWSRGGRSGRWRASWVSRGRPSASMWARRRRYGRRRPGLGPGRPTQSCFTSAPDPARIDRSGHLRYRVAPDTISLHACARSGAERSIRPPAVSRRPRHDRAGRGAPVPAQNRPKRGRSGDRPEDGVCRTERLAVPSSLQSVAIGLLVTP
jgi:hypothetical protein